jgi:predicted 3-demethylubiquinone-9 3-methyltransferase (glyoxalase superfamily)
MTIQKTTTFLMFVGDQYGKAEEAINFYTSLFEDSKVLEIERWKEGEQGGKPGMVKLAKFRLAGQEYMASENSADHAFNFTPSISIYVNCQGDEIATLFDKLSDGGQIMMPLDDYGFSTKFGWVADKYGVTWQLNQD